MIDRREPSLSFRSLVLALLLGGCVPYALPPATLELGSGARDVHGKVGRVDLPLSLRGVLDPLPVLPGFRALPVDVGAGVFLDRAGTMSQRGALLELGVLPVQQPAGDFMMRLSPRVQGRLVYDPALRTYGDGVALQLQVDFVHWADGSFSSTSGCGGAFGNAYGTSGFGFYAEGAVSQVGDTKISTVSAGVLLHVPLTFGYLWGLPR